MTTTTTTLTIGQWVTDGSVRGQVISLDGQGITWGKVYVEGDFQNVWVKPETLTATEPTDTERMIRDLRRTGIYNVAMMRTIARTLTDAGWTKP